MHKSISVWLKLKDGESKGKVALQKRSASNKSFQNIYQATWAGKVEPDEAVEEAIKRECKEELGEGFFDDFDFSSLKFFSEDSYKMKEENWTCYNYIGEVSEDILAKAKLHKESFPEFFIIGKNDLAKDIVLFEDQRKILSKILYGN